MKGATREWCDTQIKEYADRFFISGGWMAFSRIVAILYLVKFKAYTPIRK
jgi:hypothetical protein